MKKIIFFVFCLLSISNLKAQYTLTGKLSGFSNLYLEELNKNFKTDSMGVFSISNLQEGFYGLQIKSPNGIDYLLKFSIPLKENPFSSNGFKWMASGQEILLEQINTAQETDFREVIITGSSIQMQAKVTMPITLVKPNEILEKGYLTVVEAMANKPGISMLSTGPGVVRPVIRGLSGNRILTVQNGVKLENQQWDAEHTLGITQYGIRQVEIIKGPASFLYGSDALGGVIQFVDELPATQNTLQTDVYTGFNSNTFGINSGAGVRAAKDNKNWGIQLGLNNQSDYYDANFNRVANSRFREFVAKTNYGIQRKNSLTQFNYQMHLGYYGIVEPFEAKDSSGKVEEDHPMEFETPYHTLLHQTAILKHVYKTKKSIYTGTLSYQNDRRKELEKSNTESNPFLGFQLHVATVDIKMDRSLNANSSIVIGVQGNGQGNKNFGYSVLIPNYMQADFAFYALNRNTFFKEKLNLDLGMRYDMRAITSELNGIKDSNNYMIDLKKSYSNWSASLGLNYQLLPKYFLYANMGTGYRAPNLAELSSNGQRLETQRFEIGNAGMKKETSLQGELGAYSTHDYFSYNISGYLHQIKNYIFTTKRNDTLFHYPVYEYHQSNAVLTGGEVSLQVHPKDKKWFVFQTSFSSVRAKFADNSYLPLMPADKWNHELVFKKAQLKSLKNAYIRIQFTQVLAQNNIANYELRTPAYKLVNIGFGADVKIYNYKVQVNAGINNLLNEKYYDHLSRLRPYGVYNMGLNAFINLKMPLSFTY